MNPSSLFPATPIKALILLLPSLLNQAGAEWGATVEVKALFSHRMGLCKAGTGIASDFGHHEIRLNARCAWTPELLRIAVLHEYGHMLTGGAHSEDPSSVMFPQLAYGQRITTADLKRSKR